MMAKECNMSSTFKQGKEAAKRGLDEQKEKRGMCMHVFDRLHHVII